MNVSAPSWPLTIALAVSATALLVAFLNYRRKSSISLRGSYSLTSSVECEDSYVSEIVLENMKDRAVTVYGIYFLVGYSYLIELDEFGDSPLILRPFETITRQYGPIEFYGVNDQRLAMAPLLQDPKSPKRLVLSTSQGRYAVRRFPKRWHPVRDHFRNHALALVRPVRATYKHKDIGGNIRYVLDIVLSDGKDEIIMLRAEDYSSQRFKGFRLTKESLESVELLRAFLTDRKDEGILVCQSFKVFDAQAWREKERDFYKGETRRAEHMGYLKFRVLGRVVTIARDFALRRENARLAKAAQKERDNA